MLSRIKSPALPFSNWWPWTIPPLSGLPSHPLDNECKRLDELSGLFQLRPSAQVPQCPLCWRHTSCLLPGNKWDYWEKQDLFYCCGCSKDSSLPQPPNLACSFLTFPSQMPPTCLWGITSSHHLSVHHAPTTLYPSAVPLLSSVPLPLLRDGTRQKLLYVSQQILWRQGATSSLSSVPLSGSQSSGATWACDNELFVSHFRLSSLGGLNKYSLNCSLNGFFN